MNKVHKQNKLKNRRNRLIKKMKMKEGLTQNQLDRLNELNSMDLNK